MRTSDFKPPKPNRAVIALLEFLFPLYLKYIDRLAFDIVESSAQLLKSLKDKPVVIVINHTDRQDPLLVIALAKHMHEVMYCITAREVFDWNNGIRGWLFQRFGCFSVHRGAADVKSIHTIQDILSRGSGKLIVFPEGHITADEHQVHELNRSLAHILLQTQDAMAKNDSARSIVILPIGVTYALVSDIDSSVGPTLSRIEHKLQISDTGKDVATRVRNCTDSVVAKLSQLYNIVLPEGQPQHEQVSLLTRQICQRIAAYRGSHHSDDESTEQLLYHLRNEIAKDQESTEPADHYQKDLMERASSLSAQFLHALDRVERLLIFQRVLSQPTTPIQICRLVDFLEDETCNLMTAKGQQRAALYIGQPLEVLPHLGVYKESKSAARDQLSEEIRHGLQDAVDRSHAALDTASVTGHMA
jgi:1-acyl-sn-glycerol-3-phosphate acyltransferase